MVDVDNIVVEVLGHIFFVLFKCNRVTNQALLGFAGLLAVGLPSHNISLCFRKYSFFCSVLGVVSGYGLGFISGIQLVRTDQIGPAALAIFLCLGESHFYHPGLPLLILKTSLLQDWASMTCLPWSPPCRTSPSLR